MTIKFHKHPLAVEQNNYATKTVNVYITSDFDTWPRNLPNKFKFRNCLYDTTNIVKIVIKKLSV